MHDAWSSIIRLYFIVNVQAYSNSCLVCRHNTIVRFMLLVTVIVLFTLFIIADTTHSVVLMSIPVLEIHIFSVRKL